MTLIIIHRRDYCSYNVENVQNSFVGSVWYYISRQEFTLILCWFFRAAWILCKYCRFIFETFPSSSDSTHDVGNMNFDIDIEEVEEVNVKTEKVMGSVEEKCIDIKEEED